MRQRWLRVLFRRRMLTILLLLLQVYFLICLVLGGSQLSRNFSRLLTIVSIIAVLYIVSQKDKGAYKTAWAILILTFPLFGGLMYLLSNAQSSKWRFAKSVLHTQQKAKPLYALPGICYESATKQLPEYYPQIHYLQEYTGFPIYADTETHYLSMLSALRLAAKSGVDIRIITPHRWDKWWVHMTTRSYYRELIKSGVKIYEYTNGFIHSKTFVSDDRTATVGTTNLDFRSLYLHYECGALLYEAKAVMEVKEDFLQTLEICQQVTEKDCKTNIVVHLLQDILRLFAPLM